MLKGVGPGLQPSSHSPTACEYAGGGTGPCPSFAVIQGLDGGAVGVITSGPWGLFRGGCSIMRPVTVLGTLSKQVWGMAFRECAAVQVRVVMCVLADA